MAIYYTDWLNGNDTTGDGSFSTPYKSIYKASQTVSANSDEIRVIGQTETLLPGTNTVTYNGYTIATSQDLTSYFPNGTGYIRVVCSDGSGGSDVYARVWSVNSTTIDCQLYQRMPFLTGNYDIYVIPFTYYSSMVAPTSPSGTVGYFDEVDASIAAYDDIKITGGWDTATTQNGYTVFTTQGSSAASKYGTAAIKYNPGLRGEELEFSNFDIVNCNGFIKDSACSFAMSGMFRFVQCTTAVFGNSNFGIIGSKSGNPTTWYSNYSNIGSISFNGTGQAIGTPTNKLTINILMDSSSATYTSLPGHYNSLLNYNNPDDYYTRCGDVEIRLLVGSLYIGIALAATGYCYIINSIKNTIHPSLQVGGIWSLNTTRFPILVNEFIVTGSHRIILNGAGGNFTQAGYSYIGNGTQPITELTSAANNAYWNSISKSKYTSVLGSPAVLRADDGTWYAYTDTYGQFCLKPNYGDFVTGINALEVFMANGGGSKVIKVASLPKWPLASGTKTITIKMKTVNASNTGCNIIYDQSELNDNIVSSVNTGGLTTSYVDYTLTVDPSTVPDWELNSSDGYLNIALELTDDTSDRRILVDSVVIS